MSDGQSRSANDPVVHYAVDVVFCIDTTWSMTPYLDSAKATASSFHDRLVQAMLEGGKGVKQLRVRIVEFRDLGHDGVDAVRETRFFSLPEEADAYAAEVSGLVAQGGGPTPESALEALAVAFRSPWERTLDKRRHVVVMCTDAPAHPLGKYSLPEPAGQMPAWPTSMEELQAIWGDETDDGEMEYSAKRMFILAPRIHPWKEMEDNSENVVFLEQPTTDAFTSLEGTKLLREVGHTV